MTQKHNPVETLAKIQIRDIEMKDFRFHANAVTGPKGEFLAVWISCEVVDVKTGERGRLNTSDNPRLLRTGASKTRTLNLAANMLKELCGHEALEHFVFGGLRVFGPHTNVDELARICEREEA